jgi:serine/threonine-protein kinase
MVTELNVGMQVGRYRLVERIAQGGMGSVWCARDERLERGVAVKLLPRLLAADPSAERRFSREARAMGRLQHPNVVSVYDVGSADPGSGEELPFLVMELIRGNSLDLMLEKGPLNPAQAVRIMEQVCRALSAAHRVGVIHRDLKPSNIMICDDDHVKVLDFGLARLNEQEGQTPEDTLTTPGMVLGSCPYMAPEQALGQRVGPQSDIFSCGSVLYEALSGKRAFDGETPMRVLQAVVKCDYTPLDQLMPDLPAGLVKVVERCLHSEHSQRYPDCSELARELAAQGRLLSQSQVGLTPVTAPASSWTKKLSVWLLVGALSFASGLVAGLLLERLFG